MMGYRAKYARGMFPTLGELVSRGVSPGSGGLLKYLRAPQAAASSAATSVGKNIANASTQVGRRAILRRPPTSAELAATQAAMRPSSTQFPNIRTLVRERALQRKQSGPGLLQGVQG